VDTISTERMIFYGFVAVREFHRASAWVAWRTRQKVTAGPSVVIVGRLPELFVCRDIVLDPELSTFLLEEDFKRGS
jgi:hypothetical protein